MSTVALPDPAPAPTTRSQRPPTPAADVPTLPVYRLSVEQYHQMLAIGVLTTEDHVELIHGLLVPKMPKNPPHVLANRKLRRALELLAIPNMVVGTQDPIALTDSEPEPDNFLAHGRDSDYGNRHPTAAEVQVVFEVSETTLAYDRGEKLEMYAEAKIPTYWIINLVDRQVEVYSQPTGPAKVAGYKQMTVYRTGEYIPVRIDGREVGRIAVGDLLP